MFKSNKLIILPLGRKSSYLISLTRVNIWFFFLFYAVSFPSVVFFHKSTISAVPLITQNCCHYQNTNISIPLTRYQAMSRGLLSTKPSGQILRYPPFGVFGKACEVKMGKYAFYTSGALSSLGFVVLWRGTPTTVQISKKSNPNYNCKL